MKHHSISIEDILSKKDFAHFTQEQPQEFISSITILYEVIYSNINQNFDFSSDKGVNLNQEKELVYLKKAA
jgi:hypothetical protein